MKFPWTHEDVGGIAGLPSSEVKELRDEVKTLEKKLRDHQEQQYLKDSLDYKVNGELSLPVPWIEYKEKEGKKYVQMYEPWVEQDLICKLYVPKLIAEYNEEQCHALLEFLTKNFSEAKGAEVGADAVKDTLKLHCQTKTRD